MAEAIAVARTMTGTDKEFQLETGKLAGLANGAVVVGMGETRVLMTATAAKGVRDGIDFFPLTVDIEERAYAAGKIPGSFFRREGRASDSAKRCSRSEEGHRRWKSSSPSAVGHPNRMPYCATPGWRMPELRKDRLERTRHAKVSSWQSIFRVVRRIPPGRVATYGQVAEMAGMPRAARQVGWALHSLRDDSESGLEGVPWHRVINARGEISRRGEKSGEHLQRALLEAEGVSFGQNGRVDWSTVAWKPRIRTTPMRKSK